jgi:transcription termination factor NusB
MVLAKPDFSTTTSARQLALNVLLEVQRGAYADVALHRGLAQTQLSPQDRAFTTELVYGTVRRQRTLDALIDQLGNRPTDKQPPLLRLILQLGLYQLRYLGSVPASAAVNTSVDLAKQNGLSRLSGVVNGILRQYGRATEAERIRCGFPMMPLPLWLSATAIPIGSSNSGVTNLVLLKPSSSASGSTKLQL